MGTLGIKLGENKSKYMDLYWKHAFEIAACKMVVILFQSQCVALLDPTHLLIKRFTWIMDCGKESGDELVERLISTK